MSSNASSLEAIVLANTVSTSEINPSYRYGDVSIDPSAIIAPGVLLQAESDSQIIIGAGVCIGLETIIHATGGTLEIQQGSCLAMGVLLVGAGTIGKYVCIGSGTTAIDPQIEQGAVIPPHSLLGDRSRSLDTITIESEPITDTATIDRPPLEELTPDPWEAHPSTPELPKIPAPTAPPAPPAPPAPVAPPKPPEYVSIESEGSEITETNLNVDTPPPNKSIAGKEQFNRLRRKLFPDINS
jgi:carbon dioxide concentrating mechanism protein CcmN